MSNIYIQEPPTNGKVLTCVLRRLGASCFVRSIVVLLQPVVVTVGRGKAF